MNESVPCQSPFIANDFVLEIRELLPALNASPKRPDGKSWPIDAYRRLYRGANHIRHRKADGGNRRSGAERSSIGMLNLLAMLQWRQGQTQLFGLTSWVGGLVQPIINGYHNRVKRRELERENPRLVRQGNLIELARLLDNVEERAKDQRGFDEACDQWRDAAREIKEIQSGIDDRDDKVAKTAQQVAALVSVAIALVTIVILAAVRI